MVFVAYFDAYLRVAMILYTHARTHKQVVATAKLTLETYTPTWSRAFL